MEGKNTVDYSELVEWKEKNPTKFATAQQAIRRVASKEPLYDHHVLILKGFTALEEIEEPVELLIPDTAKAAVQVLQELVSEGRLRCLSLRVSDDLWEDSEEDIMESLEIIGGVFGWSSKYDYFYRFEVPDEFLVECQSGCLHVEGRAHTSALAKVYQHASQLRIASELEDRWVGDLAILGPGTVLHSVHYLIAFPFYEKVYHWFKNTPSTKIEWLNKDPQLTAEQFQEQVQKLAENLEDFNEYDPLADRECELLLPSPTEALPQLARLFPRLKAFGVWTRSKEELVSQLMRIRKLWATSLAKIVVFTLANGEDLEDIKALTTMIPMPPIEVRGLFPVTIPTRSATESAICLLPKDLQLALMSYITDFTQLHSVQVAFPILREVACLAVKCITSEQPLCRDEVLELVSFPELQSLQALVKMSPRVAQGQAAAALMKLASEGKLREMSFVSDSVSFSKPEMEFIENLVDVLQQKGEERFCLRWKRATGHSFVCQIRPKVLDLRGISMPYHCKKLTRHTEQLWTSSYIPDPSDAWVALKTVHFLENLPDHEQILLWLQKTSCQAVEWHPEPQPGKEDQLDNALDHFHDSYSEWLFDRKVVENARELMLPYPLESLYHLRLCFPHLVGLGVYADNSQEFEQNWRKIKAYWPGVFRVVVFTQNKDLTEEVKDISGLQNGISVEVRKIT